MVKKKIPEKKVIGGWLILLAIWIYAYLILIGFVFPISIFTGPLSFELITSMFYLIFLVYLVYLLHARKKRFINWAIIFVWSWIIFLLLDFISSQISSVAFERDIGEIIIDFLFAALYTHYLLTYKRVKETFVRK